MLMMGRASWVVPHRTGNTGSRNQLRYGCTFPEWEGTEQGGKALRSAALAKFYMGQAWARRKSLVKEGQGKPGMCFQCLEVFLGRLGKVWVAVPWDRCMGIVRLDILAGGDPCLDSSQWRTFVD